MFTRAWYTCSHYYRHFRDQQFFVFLSSLSDTQTLIYSKNTTSICIHLVIVLVVCKYLNIKLFCICARVLCLCVNTQFTCAYFFFRMCEYVQVTKKDKLFANFMAQHEGQYKPYKCFQCNALTGYRNRVFRISRFLHN